MPRLQLNPEEEITRKEYLKRKKKQKLGLKKKSKFSYILPICLILLSVYIIVQFYSYNKTNNFKYVEGDGVSSQKVYNMYYVTEGYTYDPIYSLSKISSDGFNDSLIYQNSGMHDILSKGNYVYGIKNGSLCRISKENSNLEELVKENVSKFILSDTRVYYVNGNSNKLSYIDLETNQIKDLPIDNVSEVLLDSNSLYVAKIEKNKKLLYKYDFEGQNEKKIVDSSNVSYITQNEDSLFFVNKDDGNKIYKVLKDGNDKKALGDIKGIADNGVVREINGEKYMFVSNNELYYVNPDDSLSLYKFSLESNVAQKVISVPIQILQNVDNTVFYKTKGEMGIYLYNYETKFMSKVSNRNVKEFSIDKTSDSIEKESNKK